MAPRRVTKAAAGDGDPQRRPLACLALYGEKGEGWVGVRACAGGKKLGAEKWTRH
jgi:hypothetical protein